MGWLAKQFRRHRSNADVVRQDLEHEHGIRMNLQTVERAVALLWRELATEAWAPVRFETLPGYKLQVDFCELRVPVEGERGQVYLFVVTLFEGEWPAIPE